MNTNDLHHLHWAVKLVAEAAAAAAVAAAVIMSNKPVIWHLTPKVVVEMLWTMCVCVRVYLWIGHDFLESHTITNGISNIFSFAPDKMKQFSSTQNTLGRINLTIQRNQ